MISAVRRLKNAPSEAKCQKIAEMLDQDRDGTLDLDDVEMVSAKNYAAWVCMKVWIIQYGEPFRPRIRRYRDKLV